MSGSSASTSRWRGFYVSCIATLSCWELGLGQKPSVAPVRISETRIGSPSYHDTPRYTKSDSDKLSAARDAAYPYRSYLAKDKQKLIVRNWLPDWRDDMGAMGISEDFYDSAKELETELDRVFGKDER